MPDWHYVMHGIAYAIIFIFGISVLLQNKLMKFRLNWISSFALLIFIYLTISLFWSVVPSLSIFSFLLYSALPLLIIINAFQEERWINFEQVYTVIVAIGIGVSIYAYYQFFSNAGYFNSTANLPFYNPNSLAVFLGICGVISLSRIRNNQLYVGALIIILIALVMTGSRAGVLIFSLIALFVILSQIYSQAKNAREFKLPLLGYIILIISLYGLPFVLDMFIDGGILSSDQMTYGDDFASARLRIWVSSIQAAIATHPFIGNGLGTFYHIYSGFRAPNDNTMGMHAHNDVLHLWVEIGFIGLLIFVLLAISVFKIIQKIMCNLNVHADKILSLSLLLFIGGMGMLTPIILLPILLLILTMVILDLETLLKNRYLQVHRTPNILAVVFMCMLGIIGITSMQYYHTQKMNRAFSDLDFNGFYHHVQALEMYSLRQNMTVPVMQAALLSSIIDNNLIDNDQREEAMSEIQEYIDEAKRRNPYNADIFYYEADLALKRSNEQSAISILKRALEYNPRHALIRLKLINLSKDNKYKLILLRDGLQYQYWQQDPTRLYKLSQVMGEAYNDQELVLRAKQAEMNYMRLKK